jgi:hypothetical protein
VAGREPIDGVVKDGARDVLVMNSGFDDTEEAVDGPTSLSVKGVVAILSFPG